MKKIKQFVCSMYGGIVFGLLLIIAVAFFTFYAAPLNQSNYNEVAEVLTTDSTTVGYIEFRDLVNYDGQEAQKVVWERVNADGSAVLKTSLVKVKKGFLKYKFDGFLITLY